MSKPTHMSKPTIYQEIISYERLRLVGFDLRGLPVYVSTACTHVVYACSKQELKKRVTEWRAYLASDTYIFHRHPRKYVEVVG